MILCFRMPTTQVFSCDCAAKRGAPSSAATRVSDTASSAHASLRSCRRAIASRLGRSAASCCSIPSAATAGAYFFFACRSRRTSDDVSQRLPPIAWISE